MQEDKLQRVYVIKDLIDSALEKSQSIASDSVPKEFVTDLLEILSEASNKISNLRWADSGSFPIGVAVYKQTIKNL